LKFNTDQELYLDLFMGNSWIEVIE